MECSHSLPEMSCSFGTCGIVFARISIIHLSCGTFMCSELMTYQQDKSVFNSLL